MFAVLWFLLVALVFALSLAWMLDHNGDVMIVWLGYEVQTDVLTAILIAVLLVLLVFCFSYLFARILAIKFPALLKAPFKRSYIRSLEKTIDNHRQAFEIVARLMLALEVGDKRSAHILQKKYSKLAKEPILERFFAGKSYLQSSKFSKASQLFESFGENIHAKVLALKSKFGLALQKNDDIGAIAYAKQILEFEYSNLDIAKDLLSLYKKHGLWQEAKVLIDRCGKDKFKEESYKRNLALINCALALKAYQKRNFLAAIKYANIVLKAESDFLPALEILLKSWIKLGLTFKAKWKIKSLWNKSPNLILAEIFDLANRNSKEKNRIRAIKKLVSIGSRSDLGDLAIGIVAFRTGNYLLAKESFISSLEKQKNHRAYKLLSACEKFLGNLEEAKKSLAKAKMLNKNDHYVCSSCGHYSLKWSVHCISCNAYDSLSWES